MQYECGEKSALKLCIHKIPKNDQKYLAVNERTEFKLKETRRVYPVINVYNFNSYLLINNVFKKRL